MNRLKLAVVGTGHLGRFHARNAAALPDSKLVAVVDPLRSAREQVAVETNAQPLSDFRDLFGLVDAAIVASPTTTHYPIVRELLQGGIHVLVEKPITTTTEQAEQLAEMARRQQLVLQVGHIERFNPAFMAVRQQITSPKFITARRLSSYSFRSTDIGVVHDLMIHDLDIVLSLVRSPVTHVDAVGISVLGQHEDLIDARLHFASGCVAQLTASRVSYENARTMQVFTDAGCATIDFGQKRARLVEPTTEILSRSFALDTLQAEQISSLRDNLFQELLVRSELPVDDHNAMEQEQLDFLAAIRTSEEPTVNALAGRDALALADEIVAMAQKHQWDGVAGNRQGILAMPASDDVLAPFDSWSAEDTVILRRKAG